MLFFLSLAYAEKLQVSSNLEGAAIWINGQDSGQHTPATLDVPPGKVTVMVQQGCQSGQATVTVSSGRETKAKILTMESQAELTINPDPMGATLLLDGNPIEAGVAVAVDCGSHVLKASKEEYLGETHTIDVADASPQTLAVHLDRVGYGTIELSVIPHDAMLLLDGKPVGKDIATLPAVAQGYHRIGAEIEGSAPAEQWLKVQPDLVLTYQIKLRSDKKGSLVVPYGADSEAAMVEADEVSDAPVRPTAPVPAPKPTPEADLPEAADPVDRPEDIVLGVGEPVLNTAPKQPALDLDEPEEVKKEREHPAFWAGVGLYGGTVLGGLGSLYLYSEAVQAGKVSDAKTSAAVDNRRLQDDADAAEAAYHKATNLFYAGAGLTGAMLVSGTLCVLLDGSTVMPLPGGGVLMWSTHF